MLRNKKAVETSSKIFHSNHILVAEEYNPLENVVIVEEKLDGIDVDGIRN